MMPDTYDNPLASVADWDGMIILVCGICRAHMGRLGMQAPQKPSRAVML